MKILLALFFVLLTGSVLLADEPQTQTQPSAAVAIHAADSQRLYVEEDFPAGTFEGLTAEQKKETLVVLNGNLCTCGCKNDTIARCRVEDPGCPTAPKLVMQVLDLVRADKDAQEIGKELEKSRPKPAQPQTTTASKKEEAIFVPYREDDPSIGRRYAKVTILGFSEFQCPYCKRVLPTLKEIESTYGDNVKIVWKHRPLPFHGKALPAAEAAEAAREQGKFWEMHDLLFENQTSLTPAKFEELASTLGLDMTKFKASLAEHRNRSRIEEDSRLGVSVGATGTPTFFINGRKVVGALPVGSFKKVIEKEIIQADQLLKQGAKLDADFYPKIVEENKKSAISGSFNE